MATAVVTDEQHGAIEVLSGKKSVITATATADIYRRYIMLYQLLVEPCPQRIVHDSGVRNTDLTEVDGDALPGHNAFSFGPQVLIELQ